MDADDLASGCLLIVLALCPEWPTYSPSRTAHILTVAVGAFVVFIPMRVLLSQIVLQKPHYQYERSSFGHLQSSALLLSGAVVALFAFFRHIPFVVIDIAELFIAYAILGGQLGLDGGREVFTRSNISRKNRAKSSSRGWATIVTSQRLGAKIRQRSELPVTDSQPRRRRFQGIRCAQLEMRFRSG